MDTPTQAPSPRKRFARMLYGVVLLNAAVWIIWAIGSHGGGIPWPAWVTLGSAGVIGSRLGQLWLGPGEGRQRNRNRNRDRRRS